MPVRTSSSADRVASAARVWRLLRSLSRSALAPDLLNEPPRLALVYLPHVPLGFTAIGQRALEVAGGLLTRRQLLDREHQVVLVVFGLDYSHGAAGSSRGLPPSGLQGGDIALRPKRARGPGRQR